MIFQYFIQNVRKQHIFNNQRKINSTSFLFKCNVDLMYKSKRIRSFLFEEGMTHDMLKISLAKQTKYMFWQSFLPLFHCTLYVIYYSQTVAVIPLSTPISYKNTFVISNGAILFQIHLHVTPSALVFNGKPLKTTYKTCHIFDKIKET